MAFRQSTAPIRNLPKIHPPPKEIPRRRPPGISYLQYRMQYWGLVPGKVSPGEAPEGLASPEEAGPSKVFSDSETGYTLKRK